MEGWTYFIFMDNFVPYDKEKAIEFEKVNFNNTENIQWGSCQDGVYVAIKNDVGIFDTFKIPDAFELAFRGGLILDRFLKGIKGKIVLDKTE